MNISTNKQLNSGNNIPIIGYGTYQLCGSYCIEGTTHALNAGYRHIDTASIYRNGKYLKICLQKLYIPRKEIYITSKIAPNEQGYQQTFKTCQNILQDLQCDYLDLLLIHWPGTSNHKSDSIENKDIRLQTWAAMVYLKQQGKVKDIGVSNFLVHHLEHLMANSQHPPAVNQLEIHPLLWYDYTINFCRLKGIAIYAYSPLARSDERLLKNPIITNLATKYHKTPAQICLKWSLQHDFIILPKSKTKNRIEYNINLFDLQLTAADMDNIDQLRNMNVRTCWDPHSIIH